ncbi:flp pilus assembly TadB domain protein, partial [Vibrio parahaemolyticus V-223/04]
EPKCGTKTDRLFRCVFDSGLLR